MRHSANMTNMKFAPAFAMPRSKKNGKKGGRKRGKKGGKGEWSGGAQAGGKFEEEADGPKLAAKKCFKCQNPRAEDCCERSRGQGQDADMDEEHVGGGEWYAEETVISDDEQDLCGWAGGDQMWNPEWRQAREEEQLRSLALWGVKGKDVFNIGLQYVEGKAVGVEALGTPVFKSIQVKSI